MAFSWRVGVVPLHTQLFSSFTDNAATHYSDTQSSMYYWLICFEFSSCSAFRKPFQSSRYQKWILSHQTKTKAKSPLYTITATSTISHIASSRQTITHLFRYNWPLSYFYKRQPNSTRVLSILLKIGNSSIFGLCIVLDTYYCRIEIDNYPLHMLHT